MGAAESINTVNIVTKAYAKIMTTMVTDQDITTDQSQVFSIDHVKGDVVIKGDVFTQTLVINLASLMKAVATQSAQDQLIDNIAQQAQAAVSGLNLAQYAYVSNNIDRLITACVQMSTDMRVSCNSKVTMTQSFSVTDVEGDVRVTDVKFNQFANILSSCAMDASVNNDQARDIVSQIKQRGDAKASGLDPTTLIVIIVLVMVGAPVGVGFLAGRRVIGPLLASVGLIGGGAVALGYIPRPVKIEGFSSDPDFTLAQPAATVKGLTFTAAVAKLKSTDGYGALFWKNYNVEGTTAVKLQETLSYFAPAGYDPASWAGAGDSAPPFRIFPGLYQGKGDPGARPRAAYGYAGPVAGPKKGDAYLDGDAGSYYVLGDSWKMRGTISGHQNGRTDYWGTVDPTTTAALTGSERYIWVDPFTLVKSTVWLFTGSPKKWTQQQQTAPLDIPLTNTPSDFNVWAYKDDTAVQAVKWSSVGVGVAGVALTASALLMPDSVASSEMSLAVGTGTPAIGTGSPAVGTGFPAHRG
ncbi:myristylated membrane protein [Cod iridovirus]|uniref:Myristylated membrane protein n=1 Tax=Cod iridovirus TaxID=1887316 RepID=A0A1B2IU38_FRG3V|nr:myristylated membrane protein [Cod iridovirus]